jgi:DNA primase
MCALLHSPGSDSDGSSSGDLADATVSAWDEDYYQNLIDQANSVPLIKVFYKYGIQCQNADFKIRCPFKFHKNGRENTPSFKYFHKTNSFHCWGCKTSGSVCQFVSAMENVSRSDAAHKVIQLFKDDLNDDEVIHVDMDERLNIMLEFSNVVRSFYQIYSTAEALAYGELACQKMDDLNLKRPNQTNEALQMIVEQLKRYFGAFK